jgi:hypothetical protein
MVYKNKKYVGKKMILFFLFLEDLVKNKNLSHESNK